MDDLRSDVYYLSGERFNPICHLNLDDPREIVDFIRDSSKIAKTKKAELVLMLHPKHLAVARRKGVYVGWGSRGFEPVHQMRIIVSDFARGHDAIVMVPIATPVAWRRPDPRRMVQKVGR